MLLLTLALGCGAPAGPPMNQPAMSAAEMPAQSAHAFDEMFIDRMVPHHQGAVAMAGIATERAEHPELKAMADGIIGGVNRVRRVVYQSISELRHQLNGTVPHEPSGDDQ